MRFQSATAGLAWFGCALTAAAAPTPHIVVLSNRADLISGGDALVRLRRKNARPAAGVWTHGVRARRGGRDRVWPQVARSAAVGVRTPTAA